MSLVSTGNEQLPKHDICIETANYLNSSGQGVFSPFGSNGNIYVEPDELPENLLGIMCLYERQGRARELTSFGDIRKPFLHIEYHDSSRLETKLKLKLIADSLHDVAFFVDKTQYYLKLQSEPAIWKVAPEHYQGSINLYVTQYVHTK